MGYRIDEIEGIGPAYRKKLATAKITNTNHFLSLCCDSKGRRAVAKECDLTEKQLLKWANMADLMRVTGVGPENAELLEAAGVDTIKELRHRKSDNLADKMSEVNAKKKLTRLVPSAKTVEKWITQAKGLDPTITH
ncbi:MAG: DUF4332 domain-containing protein [Acidobacteriota bacterium]